MQCTSAVKRVPEGQRGGTTIPMWQPNPADVADGEQSTRMNSVEKSVVPGVTEQRRAVTGGQESRAPTVERGQEGRDAEVTATHARDEGECSEFHPVESNSPVEVVSVQMKRGTEKVRSPNDDRSREMVMILMVCV